MDQDVTAPLAIMNGIKALMPKFESPPKRAKAVGVADGAA